MNAAARPAQLRQGRLAYLHLLRASREAFRGDALALRESRKALRSAFEEKRGVTDAAEIEASLRDAKEAVEFLRHNIVQAKRSERGSFVASIKTTKGEREHVDVVSAHDPPPPPKSSSSTSASGAACADCELPTISMTAPRAPPSSTSR